MTDPRNTDRLDQLLKLHAADPGDADLPYMIGLEHAKAGDAEQAVRWLDKAIAINPHYHYAYFQKAKAQDMEGETDDAVATLEAGIEKATAAGDSKALGELRELKMTMTY